MTTTAAAAAQKTQFLNKFYEHDVNADVRKKLKYFSRFKLMTAITQTNEHRMTTTMDTMKNEGLPRLTDDEYETTFADNSQERTPRPGMDSVDAAERMDAAKQSILTFSQVAKHAAAATKRRLSPKSRTDYWMINKHVNRAFNNLESKIKQNPATMTESDFKLLKQAITNFRVKLIVHDSMSYDELKQFQARTKKEEESAEKATHDAFMDKTPGNDQEYIDAKDRYLDLKAWGAEITKEIQRIEPKVKYSSMGGGLFRYDLNQPADPPGVPSQHAHIAHSTGVVLRNILSPETIRRRFISLEALTKKIRDEVVLFLTDDARHKDRHEVIKQIKESCLAAAAASAKKNKKAQAQ